MRRIAALFCIAVMAVMVTGCGHPASTHDADVKALKDLETQWNQDWAAKDPDKIVAHYANNALLMVPGMEPIAGRDAIRTSVQQMTTDPAMSLKFQAANVDVASSGDLGYTQGSYVLSMTDPQTKQVINDHGSYVTVYRKQAEGGWRAVSDIASSAVPPSAAKPAAHGKGKKEHTAASKPHARKRH